jgi:transposase
MAIAVTPRRFGIDVSRDELVIAASDHPSQQVIINDQASIRRWLKGLHGPARLAVEATNTFHIALVELAHRLGHSVYVIDGYRLNRYRESIGGRAKTDRTDAELLLRYLDKEGDELRPWSPPPKAYRRLQALLSRRAVLIHAKVALEQSLKDLPGIKTSAKALFRQLRQLDALIQKRLYQALREQDWLADARRCQGIEGIGPITAAALAVVFRRGAFRTSDAFIAYLGLDLRVRDSGRLKGRRKLTKQGNRELRRLLFLAAMTACRSATWKPFYQRHLKRGLARTQALVVLARKLARVAFAVLKTQADYQPSHLQGACHAT